MIYAQEEVKLYAVMSSPGAFALTAGMSKQDVTIHSRAAGMVVCPNAAQAGTSAPTMIPGVVNARAAHQ